MTAPSAQHELIVGIDLGTTNSLIAVCDERGPRVIPDEQGRPLLPSVVRFPAARDTVSRVGAAPIGQFTHPLAPSLGGRGDTTADDEPVVGQDAREHAVEFPTQTVYSVKRLMGRGFDDVGDDRNHLTYGVVPGARGAACVEVHGHHYTPEQVSAIILATLKSQAEAALKRPVHKTVVTVPAYFDDAQRQATRDAGRLAGLDVVRIVNEPTASALAYGIGQRTKKAETIAVYDLGGGTFDISILQVTPGGDASAGAGESFFQVLSTAGDTHLGGDDVDQMIVQLVISEIRARFGADLAFGPSTRQAMRSFAESAKVRLSSEDKAALRIDLGDGRVHERVLKREELERMITPWIDRTIRAADHALRDAKLTTAQIDRVVMVGGSTRIPLVRRVVGEFFGREPYTALDPDQVVALGAAVQASILSGANRDMLLLDVIPLSLGIETMGGAVAKLVMRNSTVPTRATEMFSTSMDGQTSVKIHVLQGERELVRDCRSLGEFHLRGIPPMPAGIPQILVEFLVDANGILNVAAVEQRSGKRASIQVVPRYGLTREEVERMEQDAFAHARQDMHAHRIIDLAVNAALDVKWIKEAIGRVADELDSSYRAALQEKIDRVQRFIDLARAGETAASIDADAFHAAKEELDHASVRLHELAITRSLRGAKT